MLTQSQADQYHNQLHDAIMASSDLHKPSALISMIMDSISQFGTDNATAQVLAQTMIEVLQARENERGPVLLPSDYAHAISEVYRRMFYTVDTLADNGFEKMAEDDNLSQFTSWNVAGLRGETVETPAFAAGGH